jgi:hypothetical protein
MNQPIPVFVNSTLVRVSPDATLLDAVRAWSADAAREVEQGARLITDSRGLPIAPETRVHSGTIVRLIAARDRDAAADPDFSS